MMRELLPDLLAWHQSGKQVVLTTVIRTWGSSPRPVGSQMAVSEDGHFCGSVSGGCVESAVIAESLDILQTGSSKRLSFGVSDETAWEVGLACGGKIELFLQCIDWPMMTPILEKIQANETTWYSITLDPAGKLSLIHPPAQTPPSPFLDESNQTATFTTVVFPAPQLIIIGGVNIAQPLVALARTLEYATILIDPRRAFATSTRFPDVDRIIIAWPQEAFDQIEITSSTAIVILSHDDKIDLPSLELSLTSRAFYVGALGSRKTQARRRKLLIEHGVDPGSLERIKGPIGLDLGGNSPTEIALAIIAEIVSASHQKIE